MSADEADEGETIEADPAEVLDPADYNQNQRLKEIHQARKDVRKALAEMEAHTTEEEHKIQHGRLAEAVAFYGHELLPLMDDADWSHEFDSNHPPDSVRHFIHQMGMFPNADWPYTPKTITMAVFARLNEFAREVGIGADFDGGNDEWEV